VRHFNGAYSVRAGYHGVRKTTRNVGLDFWVCENGHTNPDSVLVDDRDSGGFTHRERLTECQQCGAGRPNTRSTRPQKQQRVSSGR
jgi:hypothetical protein